MGRPVPRADPCGRPRRPLPRAGAIVDMDDLGRDARDFVLEGDWMPDYLATKYAEVTDELLEAVEARAQGWARRHARTHLGRLPPRQYPLDRSRAALRRSRRLSDRPCHSGPVDAAGRRAGRKCAPSFTICSKGYEQFLPFDRGGNRLDRAAARVADDSLLGMAGAALARPGLPSGFSVVCRAALLGAALPLAARTNWRRCSNRRWSCERRAYLGDHGRMTKTGETSDGLRRGGGKCLPSELRSAAAGAGARASSAARGA